MKSGDFGELVKDLLLLIATCRPIPSGDRLDQYLGGARINKIAVALRPYFGSPTLPGIGNNQVTNVDQDTTTTTPQEFPGWGAVFYAY